MAMTSAASGILGWALQIVLPERRVDHRLGAVLLIGGIGTIALVIGVLGSRRNKAFVAWRLVADVGLVLGLILIILGIVGLIVFIKGWWFV